MLVATDDYRRRSDHVGRFIDECCTTSSLVQQVSSGALFDAWSRWAAAEGCEQMSRASFAEAVEKHGHRQKRSNGKRWFQGIALNADNDE